MLKAVTLVHKGAMEIAIHSIRTFAHYFSSTHELIIHVDHSVNEDEQNILLQAARGIKSGLVTSKQRRERLAPLLSKFPKTQAFLDGTSFYTKLEIPLYEGASYFFFDSDVIWLRHVNDMRPKNALNAFSTETWTSYHGIARPHLWIKAKTPQRVNSGLHYLGQPFPIQKLEELLAMNMFNKRMLYAGDQEIFAYLYNDLEYYHPKDFKRSRNGSKYHLKKESCAALHFAGSMWRSQIKEINAVPYSQEKAPLDLRFLPAVPLSAFELFKMHLQLKMGASKLLAPPLNIYRKLMRAYR